MDQGDLDPVELMGTAQVAPIDLFDALAAYPRSRLVDGVDGAAGLPGDLDRVVDVVDSAHG